MLSESKENTFISLKVNSMLRKMVGKLFKDFAISGKLALICSNAMVSPLIIGILKLSKTYIFLVT